MRKWKRVTISQGYDRRHVVDDGHVDACDRPSLYRSVLCHRLHYFSDHYGHRAYHQMHHASVDVYGPLFRSATTMARYL